MTAQAAENAQAAAAVAAGEAASTKHHVDAEAQHRISGSTVAVEPASIRRRWNNDTSILQNELLWRRGLEPSPHNLAEVGRLEGLIVSRGSEVPRSPWVAVS